MVAKNELPDARGGEATGRASRYPRLSPSVVSLVAGATEAIVRERLGNEAPWVANDSEELHAAISQLNHSVETLHQYELGNEAEPSFILSL